MTGDEIELLKRHSAEIAQKVPAGSMIIELGSGYVISISSYLALTLSLAQNLTPLQKLEKGAPTSRGF